MFIKKITHTQKKNEMITLPLFFSVQIVKGIHKSARIYGLFPLELAYLLTRGMSYEGLRFG